MELFNALITLFQWGELSCKNDDQVKLYLKEFLEAPGRGTTETEDGACSLGS